MIIDSWNCCRISGTASGLSENVAGLTKLISDFRNCCRTTGIFYRTSGPVDRVPGQLPEVRESFRTPKTAAAFTEHKVLYLKVLDITSVNITLQDGRQQLFIIS
jgi:hypothetical protein